MNIRVDSLWVHAKCFIYFIHIFRGSSLPLLKSPHAPHLHIFNTVLIYSFSEYFEKHGFFLLIFYECFRVSIVRAFV